MLNSDMKKARGMVSVVGWLLMAAAVCLPPYGRQSSTYGHINHEGFRFVWELDGVIETNFLVIELTVIALGMWIVSALFVKSRE